MDNKQFLVIKCWQVLWNFICQVMGKLGVIYQVTCSMWVMYQVIGNWGWYITWQTKGCGLLSFDGSSGTNDNDKLLNGLWRLQKEIMASYPRISGYQWFSIALVWVKLTIPIGISSNQNHIQSNPNNMIPWIFYAFSIDQFF